MPIALPYDITTKTCFKRIQITKPLTFNLLGFEIIITVAPVLSRITDYHLNKVN